jgi:glutaconate CoA-transferase subunit A
MNGRASRETRLAEAVAGIPHGAVVGIGGALTAGHPMALVRALARRQARDLTVVAPIGSLEVDLLIAAGCVRKVVTSYVGAETAVAVGPVFRRAVQSGAVEVFDMDDSMFAVGLRAAGQRVPYAPWRGGLGTSYPELNPALVPYTSPIGGEPMLAIPAITVDVALLHAEASDRYGNAQSRGSGYMDPLLGAAASRVLLQVDRLVEPAEIRRHPERTTFWRDVAIVRTPFGTHPFSSGSMLADAEHLRAFGAAGAAGGAELDDYLQRHVRKPEDHEAYLEEIGVRRLTELMI